MIRDTRIAPVLNSRGETTIRAEIVTAAGAFSAIAPAGKSKGRYEARSQTFAKIKKIFPAVRKKLLGLDEREFSIVDDALEELGTDRMGGNLAIAISMAAVRAAGRGEAWAALGRVKSFPRPLGNVVGGGAHGGGLSIQEVLVAPLRAKTVSQAIETNWSIWRAVGAELAAHGIVGRNDEGAWVSTMDEYDILDIVRNAARRAGAAIGIDVAAGQLWNGKKYRWSSIGRQLDVSEQLELVLELIKKFGLFYVEDPFIETDWSSWAELHKRTKCLLCGDDLFATQPNRLTEGIRRKAANAIIIKPDQVSTVSKALRTANIARRNNIVHVVSHRSGESCDPFIADLAVATGAPLIKCGISGGERVAKANRLAELWAAAKGPRMARLKL